MQEAANWQSSNRYSQIYKNSEELLDLAKEEDIELTDELLSAISDVEFVAMMNL